MNPKNFFAELKRRNVYKVAIAYAVVGWLVVQIASTVLPTFHAPEWVLQTLVVLVALGFPIALLLAWAFELTPEGIVRTEDVAPNESVTRGTGRKLTAIIIAVALMAVGLFLFQMFRAKPAPIAVTGLGATTAPQKSIAVLPFENLSDDKQNAFFTDGVQDEILTDLAKIADLKVISRTSAMQYKSGIARNLREIGQQLGVAHLLEGSVQRAGGKVRVNAQLIDARTDAHLWAQTYDRDLADVFAIQTEIAKAIADQLQAKLSPKEKAAIEERPTKDLAAYDLYLQAKELLYAANIYPPGGGENAFKAVQLLDQAQARDPAFLLAHCQLALAHDFIYWFNYDHTEARLSLGETSVRAAARLQPDSGETHLAQAIHFYWGYRDYDRAREELAQAEKALPNNTRIFVFLGLINRRQGRWEEAIRNLEHAIDLDPRNVEPLSDLTLAYVDLRKYTEATAMLNRALALEPRSASLRVRSGLIKVQAEADTVTLRSVLNTIEAEGPSSAAEVAHASFRLALRERDPAEAARALASIPSEGNVNFGFVTPHAWYEGGLAKLRQDAPAAHAAFTAARAEVEKIALAQPANPRPLSMLALIDAELGEKEKAIHEGRAACDMLPVAKDAAEGVRLIIDLASIYALTGEKDLALEWLEMVSKLPSGPSYGELRLDPEWDSLRDDPRFQKIVAFLAPKPANK
jgi:TolB-like protein/Tfp pilus assembly protein PilF